MRYIQITAIAILYCRQARMQTISNGKVLKLFLVDLPNKIASVGYGAKIEFSAAVWWWIQALKGKMYDHKWRIFSFKRKVLRLALLYFQSKVSNLEKVGRIAIIRKDRNLPNFPCLSP